MVQYFFTTFVNILLPSSTPTSTTTSTDLNFLRTQNLFRPTISFQLKSFFDPKFFLNPSLISYPTLVSFELTTGPDGLVGGGLNDNNATLNSVDVVVEVGVELGNIQNRLFF